MLQGANVYVTMWDRDQASANSTFIPYDLIDEFSFDFFTPLGAPEVKYTEYGIRPVDKTT